MRRRRRRSEELRRACLCSWRPIYEAVGAVSPFSRTLPSDPSACAPRDAASGVFMHLTPPVCRMGAAERACCSRKAASRHAADGGLPPEALTARAGERAAPLDPARGRATADVDAPDATAATTAAAIAHRGSRGAWKGRARASGAPRVRPLVRARELPRAERCAEIRGSGGGVRVSHASRGGEGRGLNRARARIEGCGATASSHIHLAEMRCPALWCQAVMSKVEISFQGECSCSCTLWAQMNTMHCFRWTGPTPPDRVWDAYQRNT